MFNRLTNVGTKFGWRFAPEEGRSGRKRTEESRGGEGLTTPIDARIVTEPATSIVL